MMKKRRYNIPAVEVSGGRVVWRPYIPKADRTDGVQVDSKGRLSPPIKLGKDGADPDSIMRSYLKAKASLQKTRAARLHTLRWVMDEYRKSRQYSKLAVGSRKRDEFMLSILEQPLEIDGKPDVLGNMHILDVNKPLFHEIQEARYSKRQAAGQKGEANTNRELALISSSLSWAVNYVSGIGLDMNPLKGFKRLEEEPNKRYVTDAEYQRQLELAAEDKDNLLPIVFELTYLTAARGGEVRTILVSDCTEEGIHINRTKGSKSNVILWTPRLRAAYDAALLRHRHHKILPINPPLVLNRDGQPLSVSGLNSAMQRLKKKMASLGLADQYWNLHLLKSKGVSDSDDKRIAGHKSAAMRERYNTKKETHKAAR